MDILAVILLVVTYFAFAFPAFVNALRCFYDNRLHGMLLAAMLLVPYLMVGLPAGTKDPAGFLAGLGIMAAYILIPAALMMFKPRNDPALDFFDICTFLIVWLSVEFNWLPQANASLPGGLTLPIPLLTAIALGFLLFLVLRPLEMGYSFRLGWRDVAYALTGWGAFFLVGLPLGLSTGFIQIGLDSFQPGEWLLRFVLIYLLNALPEELLFRGIIQNLVEMRLGRNWKSLGVAAVIFGLSHINNTTAHHAPPNWPYVAMATLAGVAYGWSWRKSGKITGSALTHTLVNFAWSLVFRG